MDKQIFTHKRWSMAIFPLLEIGLFIAGVLNINNSLLLSITYILAAAVFLSFSVHIFFHECVHRAEQYPAWFNLMATAIIGLPFDGYRIHHYNHHQYENGLKDFSTTWMVQNNMKTPRPLLSYVFGWHRQLLAGIRTKTPFGDSPAAADLIKQRIPAQKRLLLVMYALALIINWQLLMAYLLLIYSGWALTALQNYGQHPPVKDGQIRSFVQPHYNRLFFNNGLHWEHHNNPSLYWYQLTPDNNSKRISHAHLLNPLLQPQGDRHG